MTKPHYSSVSALLLCLLASTATQADSIYDEDKNIPELREPQASTRTYSPDAALEMSVGGEIGARYNDNIYRAPGNEEGDLIGVVAPGFRIKSDYKPYIFQLDTRLEAGRYFGEDKNNYNDADVRGKLGYELDGISTLYADGRYNYSHVDIGAFVDDPQLLAEEPTTYRFGEAGAGWKLDSANWIGMLDWHSQLYNYDNIDRVLGARIVNDDRDFMQHNLTARGGYKFWPQTALYLEGSLNRRDYDKQIDSSLTQARDSEGYALFTGVAYGKPQDIWFVDAGLGYLNQDYDTGSLPDVDLPAVRAMLQWKPNKELRIRGDVSREIREVALLNVSSYTQTRARMRAEYEFAPQWTVGGGLRYTENDFQVNPTVGQPKRLDTLWDESLSLDYAITPDYSLGGEVMRVNRNSDDSRVEFDANVAMLRFRVNY